MRVACIAEITTASINNGNVIILVNYLFNYAQQFAMITKTVSVIEILINKTACACSIEASDETYVGQIDVTRHSYQNDHVDIVRFF